MQDTSGVPADVPGYVQIHRLRCLGAIDYLGARDSRTGEPRILVTAANGDPGVPALLETIACAHRSVAHPWVPGVAATGPGFVALRAGAAADLEAITDTVRTTGYHLSEDGIAAFAATCLAMLQDAHRVVVPETGRPLCLGVFAPANVLVDEDGGVSFLGWGHPHHGPLRARLLPGLPASFAAPEVALGRDPVPGSDLTGATHFFHSFLGLQSLQPPIVAALRGEPTPLHPRLPALLDDLVANAHAPRPEDRSISRFLETFLEVLAQVGASPNLGALRTDLARMVGAARPRLAAEAEARWLQVAGGEVRDLARRGPLRRVLRALLDEHRRRPGRATSWESLFAAGWPGERPSPESARNRVYVAVAELRGLGLRELLVRRDDGYLLEPQLRVELAAAGADPPRPTGG